MTQVRFYVSPSSGMDEKPQMVLDLRRENLSRDEEDIQRADIVPSLMQRCDDP